MSTKVLNPFSSDIAGEQRAKPVPPKPKRLMADLNTAFMQQIFDISKRKRISNLHHNRQPDISGDV